MKIIQEQKELASSPKKYSPLFHLLEEIGHYGNTNALSSIIDEYHKIPYSPESLVGLFMHSHLSSWPRKNFFTDGLFIYYPSGPQPFQITANSDEDIMREHVILSLLDTIPPHLNIYNRDDGHCSFASFAFCFQNLDAKNIYQGHIKKIAHDMVTAQKFEEAQIPNRMRKNEKTIAAFANALKKEQGVYTILARKLQENLTRLTRLEFC